MYYDLDLSLINLTYLLTYVNLNVIQMVCSIQFSLAQSRMNEVLISFSFKKMLLWLPYKKLLADFTTKTAEEIVKILYLSFKKRRYLRHH